MPRRTLMLCGLLPALAFPAMAQASDASLVRALAPYKATLTNDVIFVAEVTAPPTSATAGAYASHLTQIQKDMATVGRVARGQTPSTSAGRSAQSEALSGLSYVYGAAGDGLAAIAAVRAGKAAAARTDVANLRAEVAKAIPPFEKSGKTLGLFNG